MRKSEDRHDVIRVVGFRNSKRSSIFVSLQIVQGNIDFNPFDVFETPHDFPYQNWLSSQRSDSPGDGLAGKSVCDVVGVAEILARCLSCSLRYDSPKRPQKPRGLFWAFLAIHNLMTAADIGPGSQLPPLHRTRSFQQAHRPGNLTAES